MTARKAKETQGKIHWSGQLICVQPRIRLTRSFDERSHTYLGYVLGVEGSIGEEERELLVGVGKAAHTKHRFAVGFSLEGYCEHPLHPRVEPAEFYKVSGIGVRENTVSRNDDPPPWLGVPPDLVLYRQRGHRRLSARAYASKCLACIWGCRMAVEMIVDHWNPQQRRYRFETFCYGPKSCPFYSAGPTRKVPGRKGMRWEEPDWVDEEATSHRQPDE